MKGLWRKTAKLFLNYPILWLPYICARLMDDSLHSLQHAADIRVIQNHFATARAMIAWLPVMDWGLRYLRLCIDTIALVATAKLVTMIVRGEQPRLRTTLAELWNYPKRILSYSFKLYLLSVAFAIVVSHPALLLLNWVTHSTVATAWSRVANAALVQGQGLVSIVLFAWIITPVTIRLLRAPDAEPPSAVEKKLGRYFVILIGSGTSVLSVALLPIMFNVKLVALLSPIPEQIYFSLVHLVLSFPYLMGDIAVALIAIHADWNPGESATDRMRRGIVRKLMPLHFGEREEH
jgi:hypothetical protein